MDVFQKPLNKLARLLRHARAMGIEQSEIRRVIMRRTMDLARRERLSSQATSQLLLARLALLQQAYRP